VSFVVLRGGLHTTVQDAGAPGFARYGVPERGALDDVSLRIANMLVGNDEGAACLELTLDGPHLLFERGATVAITGASMSPCIGERPVGEYRPIDIGPSCLLRFGAASVGMRAYVAIGGGIDVPVVLGSRGTHTRARFGGLEGRTLRAGDRIMIGGDRAPAAPGEYHAAHWFAGHAPLGGEAIVRIIASPDQRHLARSLFEEPLTVSAQSDRMGIRLVESVGAHDVSITSEPAPIGAVQLPPDGRPIVLMNDHQTTGGYPIIGCVAAVDRPLLAQARPGERIRCEEIAADRALALLRAREQELQRLRRWIELQRSAP
jgi:antagonist of KipI